MNALAGGQGAREQFWSIMKIAFFGESLMPDVRLILLFAVGCWMLVAIGFVAGRVL
jgi:hypothetical protein